MPRRWRRGAFCAVAGLVLVAAGFAAPERAGAAPDSPGVTTRVSVKSGGAQADAQAPAGAGAPAVSGNGSVVAFTSDATNLVPDDHNGASDVFVSQNGKITRVSLGDGFTEADGPSFAPVLSYDGQFVAFTSAADNLVPGDTNGALDVFVYDRSSSRITRVSVAQDGSQADGDSGSPSISHDGRTVAFASAADNLAPGDTNGRTDVFIRTLESNASTTLVSVAAGGPGPGNGASDEPSLDSSGTEVAFSSQASDLVEGDTNGKNDVFVRNLTTGATERVSLKDGGSTVQGDGDSFGPSISGDGTMIAFASDATNLSRFSDDNDATDVFLRDRTDLAHPSTDLLSRCALNVGDGQSLAPRISRDVSAGNTAAGVSFVSEAENLLQGSCKDPNAPTDHNHVADVYFRPLRQAPVVNERISRDPAGAEFTRPSLESAVSGDGRTVVFGTGERDAATGGPGAGSDVFVRNRGTTPATTALVSNPPSGTALGPAVTEFPAISGDGNTVAFASAASDLVTDDTNGLTDVFVYDRSSHETSRVSLGMSGAQPDGPSATDSPPAVSGDGRVVAFASRASNLVPGDTNGLGDVFVYDRARKETTRVSVGPNGAAATGGESYSPAISADGRYVAFASDATNLVDGDTNRATDVFVYDRQARTTTRVSVDGAGGQADDVSSSPTISGDGSVVAFVSLAHLGQGDPNDVADVFIRDLEAGTTTEVRTSAGAVGDAASSAPTLSADGRYVAFVSTADNIVAGDTNHAADVFVYDRRGATVERVSVGAGGGQGDRASDAPSISADGRFVAFQSDAGTLVPTDTNRRTDVFVRDRRLGTTTRVSVGPASAEADRPSTAPSIAGNGRYVAFQSAAGNLVPGDTNSAPDIFVHDRTPVRGYWLVASDGGIFAYGSAGFAGSTGSMRLARPVVGMAATPTGRGYWLVASDGGVFSFGDAVFFGSTGAIRLAQPMVGMAASPTGRGYWLVARDGGIFAFGDGSFLGSAAGLRLNQPIVGMVPTQSGSGYWLTAADGGVFPFGDAAFFGSTGAMKLNRPIVGLSASPTGAGYWLVASDGGIFGFGDATFFGSAGVTKLVQPVVGLAARP